MKITLTKQEKDWIERTADIETARLFQNFNHILGLMKDVDDKSKVLLSNQITELIELYTFLKTLRSKLELWDCRYDIDTEINFKDKEK
ncbi:MAG: hypothetical protein AABW67_04165 [Nanoarchaeota archaeon]